MSIFVQTSYISQLFFFQYKKILRVNFYICKGCPSVSKLEAKTSSTDKYKNCFTLRVVRVPCWCLLTFYMKNRPDIIE